MDRFSDNSFSSPQNPHGQLPHILNLWFFYLIKKKNISAPYIREQENFCGIRAKTALVKYFFFL